MKEAINIRLDKDILDQIKNYQLLIGKQSGFVPSRTSVIEKMIVRGLESSTEEYEIIIHTPQDADIDDQAEIHELQRTIYDFTQVWLENSDRIIEE